MFRYLIIFALGFILTFALKGDFFTENNNLVNILFRVAFALFFLLMIRLVQGNKRELCKEKVNKN